jgi:hypothetical protein
LISNFFENFIHRFSEKDGEDIGPKVTPFIIKPNTKSPGRRLILRELAAAMVLTDPIFTA